MCKWQFRFIRNAPAFFKNNWEIRKKTLTGAKYVFKL